MKLFKTIAIFILCFSSISMVADDLEFTGSASINLFNRYIFRGYELGEDNGVIQTSLELNVGSLSFAYWGNIDTEEEATVSFAPDSPGHKSFNESDISVSYSHSFGKVSMTAGWVYYATKYADETQELWMGLSYDVWGTPTLTVYRDIDAYPSSYLNFSLSHSVPISKQVTLDLGASAGYVIGGGDYWNTYDPDTEEYTGDQYAGLHDGMLSLGLTVPLSQRLSLQPVVQYFFPLSKDAERVVNGSSFNPNGYLDDTLLYGATVSFSF
ncbi:MAG TPA: hypothetical protein PK014_11245 [Thermoanaerobaculia bacterium]|nr:hypothetical protein [Thermoanaerobaculia bacterium]HUM30697.1 hypothetical protein [Thermoanaerobaculia bacterium]HXK68895.1 hypothetical protein [Thermoanaerobaculia bacterium]